MKRNKLAVASLAGDAKRVRKLLREGADPNAATPVADTTHALLGRTFTTRSGGRTPLMMAAHGGHVEAMQALLEAGARVDPVAEDGDTALCEAASAGKRKALALLVERGADVNQQAMFTPLYRAASGGRTKTARWLLEHGAHVDAQIWTGTTPLIAAAAAGSLETVALLLDCGADPTLSDDDGCTALHAAVTRHGSPDEPSDPLAIVRALLGAHAAVDARDADGATPLSIVAGRYDDLVEVAAALTGAGASLETTDRAGRTPLLRACAMNQLDIALHLLDASAELEAIDAEQATPLHHAARNGYVDLGCELLARGAQRSGALEAARGANRDDFVRMLDGERLPATQIPRSIRAIIDEAQALYTRNDYAGALAVYERVPASFRSRIFAVLSNTGYCLQQLGRHAEAEPVFAAAVAMEPAKGTHLYKALCYGYFESKSWEAMLRAAERGIELAPTDDYLWQQRALAHASLGEHHRAIDAGRRAVALNPNNAYAHMNLANAYREIGDGERHVDALVIGLELAPDLVSSLDPEDITALRADPRHADLVRRFGL